MSSSRSCGVENDVGEARGAEDPPHPRFAGEGEGPRRLGVRLGQRRGVLARFAQRQDEEGVLPGLAPAGEGKPAARLEALAQVGERSRWIGEEHDAEPRNDEVGAVGLEIIDGGVGAFEPDRQALRRPLASARQHRLGNVEPEDLATRTDAGGEVDRRRAAAAADIDHAIARFWRPLRRSAGRKRAAEPDPDVPDSRSIAVRRWRSNTRTARHYRRGLAQRTSSFLLRHVVWRCPSDQVFAPMQWAPPRGASGGVV